MKKLLALFLVMCLSLTYMAGAVSAREMAVAELVPEVPVTFTVTQDDREVAYGFTAEESGTYVLYDVDGGHQTTQIRVERMDAERQTELVARGTGRVVFSAVAGENYLFVIDCSFKEAAMEFEFMLSKAVEPQALGISGRPLDQGFVGDESALRVEYHPANAVTQMVWSSTDPGVVTVEGDDSGVTFRQRNGSVSRAV